MTQMQSESSLADLVDLLRRGLWWALVGGALAATVTYYLVQRVPPTYEARATLVASAQDPNQRDFGTTVVTAPAFDVATYRSAIVSRPVLADAYRQLYSLDNTAAVDVGASVLAGSVTVRTEDGRISSVVRIHARAGEPGRARDVANAVAAAAVRWDERRATQSLETIIDSLEAQIASLDLEINLVKDLCGELPRVVALAHSLELNDRFSHLDRRLYH
jgi:uncharacterized protein involved in exopolysaccharide biosynthesis